MIPGRPVSAEPWWTRPLVTYPPRWTPEVGARRGFWTLAGDTKTLEQRCAELFGALVSSPAYASTIRPSLGFGYDIIDSALAGDRVLVIGDTIHLDVDLHLHRHRVLELVRAEFRKADAYPARGNPARRR